MDMRFALGEVRKYSSVEMCFFYLYFACLFQFRGQIKNLNIETQGIDKSMKIFVLQIKSRNLLFLILDD